jgi:hypothetical protein
MFDRDPPDVSSRIKTVYSYATIADTFFWGEKKKFLPFFQERLQHSTKPPRALHIVSSSETMTEKP